MDYAVRRELDFGDLPAAPPAHQFQPIRDDDEPMFVPTGRPDDATIIGDCPICHEDLESNKAVNLMCGHLFHVECANTWRRVSGGMSCPLCRLRMQQIRQIAVDYQNVLERNQRVMQSLRDGLQDIIDLTREDN